MNNSMPSMPGMPEVKKESIEDSGVKSSESLDVPSHEDDKPKLMDPAADSTKVATVIAPKKGIEVVATRKAFYNQNRIVEDQRLFLKSEEDLGEWHYCVDSFWEKKRVEYLKQKKAKK